MAKPMPELTSGEMVAISSALLEPPKREIVEGDPLLVGFIKYFENAKESLVKGMQTQKSTLTEQEREQIRALLRGLDDEYDFNARALYHLLDKIAYAFPNLREDLAYTSSVIYRDGLELITSSTMHEAGEAERMQAEVAQHERVQRVLALRVVDTPLSDFFEKVVTIGLQMKDVAARLSADKNVQELALSETQSRQRWMFLATTFLRAVRMSDLPAGDKATLYQLLEQSVPA
jgi:hypothetical protein